ncbi:sodium channel modifier 1-like isoform X2 [Glandiceps talaboti]
MSFKREGDDYSLLNVIKKRRVAELLANDIPDDEAILMANGRYACTVCYHRPVFDTVDMLSLHRKGKKHKANLERHHRKQKEIANLKLKRAHEQYLKQMEGKEKDDDKQKERNVPKLLAETHKIAHHALLKSAPYNSCVKKGRNEQTSETSGTTGAFFRAHKPTQSKQTHETDTSDIVPGAYVPKRLRNASKQRNESKQANNAQRTGYISGELDSKTSITNTERTEGELKSSSRETVSMLSTIPTDILFAPPPPPPPELKGMESTVSYPSKSTLISTDLQSSGSCVLPSSSSSSSSSSVGASESTPRKEATSTESHCIQQDEGDKKTNKIKTDYDREKRKAEAEYYIKMKSSGWIMDHRSGKWVKDDYAEFDSDEDEPPLFP